MKLQFYDNPPPRQRQDRVMKKLMTGILLAALASASLVHAGTNEITTLVQKGLFEQEANHHLDAAIECYQEAIGNFDRDRQLAATAVFQLGECYRLQGKTNEANAQYQRVVREFADQAQLVALSEGYLPKTGSSIPAVSQSSGLSDAEERILREVADQAQLAALSTQSQQSNISDAEAAEIYKIKSMVKNSPDLINAREDGTVGAPLVVAAHNGWMSAAKLLLDNGAAINPETPRSFTPLTAAAQAGNRGMIDFLLSKGA